MYSAGLSGSYDYKIRWATASGLPPGRSDPGPVATAMEEQLGLRLESRPMTVDVIRVVCRQGFTLDLATRFLESLAKHTERLAGHPFPLPRAGTAPTFAD